MSKTAISYLTHVINPYCWYCQRTSTGCKFCYMFAMVERWNRPDPRIGFETRWDEALKELAQVPSGARVGINLMSDTYLDRASDRDVVRCHELAESRPDVYFIIVTKRPERAYFMRDRLPWPDNLWLMVTVENERNLWRIDYALATGAKHVAVSAEPLLGPLPGLWPYLSPAINSKPNHLCPRIPNGRFVKWVIAGGESGDKRRGCDKDHLRLLRDLCDTTPFYLKQGDARFPGRDRVLDGLEYNEIPEAFGGGGKKHMLTLYTTRVDQWCTDECERRGITYLDVTRKSGAKYTPAALRRVAGSGQHFAPSQHLLTLYKGWYGSTALSWSEYTRRFTVEMRQSVVMYWNSWKWLLHQREVALACYCAEGDNCHRHLLVDLITKVGATRGITVRYGGEIVKPKAPRQLTLFDALPETATPQSHYNL